MVRPWVASATSSIEFGNGSCPNHIHTPIPWQRRRRWIGCNGRDEILKGDLAEFSPMDTMVVLNHYSSICTSFTTHLLRRLFGSFQHQGVQELWGVEVGHQHLQNQLQSHHWHQLQGSNFLLSGKVVHTTLQQHQPENIGQINNEIKFSGESNT